MEAGILSEQENPENEDQYSRQVEWGETKPQLWGNYSATDGFEVLIISMFGMCTS